METKEFDFSKIIAQFQVEGEFVSAQRYGCGHINDTFDVHCKNPEKRYILQCVNHHIFKNVPALMNNIRMVTEYQRQQIVARGGNPDRECLTLVKTNAGEAYYFDGENYFRLYLFIDDATTYQIVENAEDFKSAGEAFGKFQNLLASFDASKIYEVIPNFHNTAIRYDNFVKALNADKMGRAKDVRAEIDFVLNHKKDTEVIVELLKSGKLPLKVTHNDTKLNNVMIDDETKKGICVIDLDTIMPGTSLYDFGDSIRFGTNPTAEDEVNLSKVNMDMKLFDAYADGFINAVRGSLTETEAEYLAYSSLVMTLECGIRFLTDYLEGDTYFKIHRPAHNLDRTRTQFKLVSDMEKNMPEMNKIVMKYYKG